MIIEGADNYLPTVTRVFHMNLSLYSNYQVILGPIYQLYNHCLSAIYDVQNVTLCNQYPKDRVGVQTSFVCVDPSLLFMHLLLCVTRRHGLSYLASILDLNCLLRGFKGTQKQFCLLNL